MSTSVKVAVTSNTALTQFPPDDPIWRQFDQVDRFPGGHFGKDRMAEILGSGDYTGLIFGDDQIDRSVLVNGGSKPRVRYMSKPGIGVDGVCLLTCRELGIKVANTPGVNAVAVGNHAYHLITELLFGCASATSQIAALKNEADAARRKTAWTEFRRKPRLDPEGLTLGVIGFGATGNQTAKLGAAAGMNIILYEKFWNERVHAQRMQVLKSLMMSDEQFVHVEQELPMLLGRSDVVSINMSASEQDRNFFNAGVFALMKPGALLVNVARGLLVNETDLAEAIRSGQIGGFATDVFQNEPVRHDDPLLALAESHRVIFSAHMASKTTVASVRQAREGVDNLARMLRGEEPTGVVV